MDYLKSKTELYNKQNKLIEATLSLFKAVPSASNTLHTPTKLYNEINVEHGFYITEKAYKKCPQIAAPENLELIEKLYGYDIIELNRGFYKSFGTVKDTPVEDLVANQILHYFTTYGLESSLGIRNENVVYIPNDELELPTDAKPIKITIIDFISREEIKQRTIKLITSGMALSKDTLGHILTIIQELKLKTAIPIDEVPNKELRIKLCELCNLLPTNPIEFLRYMVYKKLSVYSDYLIKNPTLLIKNNEYINAIRFNTDVKVESYFDEYMAYDGGVTKLAAIFHRYKPLWLAFKKESSNMASIINKIRKLADKYHKPLNPKILDTITSSKEIDMAAFARELEKVTIFKKISLANSILFRCAAPESIVFFIRNGKAFATEYNKNFEPNEQILDMLIYSIVEAVRPQVEGKSIYIPDNFSYAMPTSEKLFWGNIPYNSSYTIPGKDIVIAVHWLNVKDNLGIEHRVDLDLHYQSSKYDVGWNTHLIDENIINTKTDKIIFSGDMTDAPIKMGGATEAFFIGQTVVDDMAMINLNNYTANKMSVPFKFVIDKTKGDRIDRKYLINSHTMSFCIPNELSDRQKFLGLLHSDEEGNKKFYFTSAAMNQGIVSKYDTYAEYLIKARMTSFESCLKLKDVLQKAGAIFEKAEEAEWDINLDPQFVTKDTIMNLLV